MKRIGFLILLCYTLLGGLQAQKTVVDDPNAVLRTINGRFDRIRVSGAVELILNQHPDQAVVVSANDPDDADQLVTELDGDLLKIYPRAGGRWSYRGNKGFKVYVSVAQLRSVFISGASNVKVAGMIRVPKLSIHLDGASKFRGGVEAADLDLDLSGASAIRLMGSIERLRIDASGASDIKAFDATAQTCAVQLSGASDLQLTVTKKLSVQASGASNIQYKGNPQQVESDVSGASRIRSVE